MSKTVNGKGTNEDRLENIHKLLNFFPVIGEDDEGKMIKLDEKQVLSIPRRLKSREVVNRGFMCNYLFQNISNVFSASAILKDIMDKLPTAQEESSKVKNSNAIDGIEDIHVDEDGNIEVSDEIVIGKYNDLFGDKIYETMDIEITPYIEQVHESNDSDNTVETILQASDNLVNACKEIVKKDVIQPVVKDYSVKKGLQSRLERDMDRKIDSQMEVHKTEFNRELKSVEAEHNNRLKEATTEEQVKSANDDYESDIKRIANNFNNAVVETVTKTIQEQPKEIIERVQEYEDEQKKKAIEDDIRAHLRGFSRTIPSFIMAYGNENLTLANFDDYTEDEVFEEVTGITEEDFRFLRDGGDRIVDGETMHFDGHLFDKVVFNDSIKAFLKKRQELANYFDESLKKDIFDYIPPQKTNQIFTPKWVVKKMVDELEENNPNCFDNPDKTFLDPYMKSGLFITEIVKRLFRSKKMKEYYPNDNDRIAHILEKQVYGIAPTRIIYLIATNYIFGFDEDMKINKKHFVKANDILDIVKNDNLQTFIDKNFEK